MLYDRNLRVAPDKDFVTAESNVHKEIGIYAYMYIIYGYSYIYIFTINIEETYLDVNRRILGLFRETLICTMLINKL